MPYCPKCGAEVSEEMNFCSKCGSTLGPLPPRMRREKEEKTEKHEKREKSEKTEKYEKREYGYIGPLIGGLILIVVGLMAYLAAIRPMYFHNWGPILLIAVGIIILVITIYAAMTAAQRSPKPP
ncbi:MAG: zinc-ribbon domain-containing protein [Candidatus Bathyarchaeia archaeon]